MNIKLTKMQGLGNDFVILDYSEYEKTGMSMSDLAKKLCNRNFGVGADGMIIPDLNPKAGSYKGTDKQFIPDIAWYFYNSDGTTAQMCGNGIRCFAKYVKDKKLVHSNQFSVGTLAGIIVPEILDDGNVKVNMSKPKVEYLNKDFNINDRDFKINSISMGNPHCVIFNGSENLLELAQIYGPDIESHSLFPEKTNVEFVKVISKNEIDMRVYERGCGITLACGTGACASVVAGILNNLTENKVKVNLLGGSLIIEWQGSSENYNYDVFMSGPAEYSFFAEYIL
ncbi:MAG: diaminopimelate epimerase [Candidatus Gastranaerophilales bacterium]|nr:diaminopimelate epimerase [Candidatus Gastranaerophilales bacterium]